MKVNSVQRDDKSACIAKIGEVFVQKFRLRRLLPVLYPPVLLHLDTGAGWRPSQNTLILLNKNLKIYESVLRR